MLILLFASCNLPKSFLEDLKTVDKIYCWNLARMSGIRNLARMWFPGSEFYRFSFSQNGQFLKADQRLKHFVSLKLLKWLNFWGFFIWFTGNSHIWWWGRKTKKKYFFWIFDLLCKFFNFLQKLTLLGNSVFNPGQISYGKMLFFSPFWIFDRR